MQAWIRKSVRIGSGMIGNLGEDRHTLGPSSRQLGLQFSSIDWADAVRIDLTSSCDKKQEVNTRLVRSVGVSLVLIESINKPSPQCQVETHHSSCSGWTSTYCRLLE